MNDTSFTCTKQYTWYLVCIIPCLLEEVSYIWINVSTPTIPIVWIHVSYISYDKGQNFAKPVAHAKLFLFVHCPHYPIFEDVAFRSNVVKWSGVCFSRWYIAQSSWWPGFLTNCSSWWRFMSTLLWISPKQPVFRRFHRCFFSKVKLNLCTRWAY